jgi:hypothetical protein
MSITLRLSITKIRSFQVWLIKRVQPKLTGLFTENNHARCEPERH